MHARLQEGQPDQRADHDVDRDRADADQIEHVDQGETRACKAKPAPGQRVGKDEGDNQHRHQVVDDGQRQQQDLEPKWHALTKQGEAADDKRDVGGHWDRPAALARLPPLQGEIDRRRHHHPAEGRKRWQQRLAPVAKLAVNQLALDLEADDKEEDRHQPVVDNQVADIAGQGEAADRQRHRDLPEPGEPGGRRGVGEHQGRGRTGQQHHAAGGLDVQKPPERRQPAVDRRDGQQR